MAMFWRVNAIPSSSLVFHTFQHISLSFNILQLQQQLQQQEQQQQQRQAETKIDVKMSTALSAIYKNSNQDRYQRTSHHSCHLATQANKKMG
jgi:hypothetical protein